MAGLLIDSTQKKTPQIPFKLPEIYTSLCQRLQTSSSSCVIMDNLGIGKARETIFKEINIVIF